MEVIQEEQEKKEEKMIILDCEKTRLLIGAYPVKEKLSGDNKPMDTAVSHYINCEDCRKLGLSAITGHSINCQQALEIWAANSGPFFLRHGVTLEEEIACEHVWGRGYHRQDLREYYGQCQESSCQKLFYYWLEAPLSCQNDGEVETAEQIPFMIKIFAEQGWSLERLFELQLKRLHEVTELAKKRTERDYPIYLLQLEIKANLNVLQSLALKQ